MKIFNLFELRRWDVPVESIGTPQEGGTSGLPSPEEMAADLSDLEQEPQIDLSPATPEAGVGAPPVFAPPVDNESEGRRTPITAQTEAPVDQRTPQQEKFDEWKTRHGISVGEGKGTEDTARFNAANKLVYGGELTDDELSALREEDITELSDSSKTEALLKRKKGIGKKTPAADSGEPLPAEASDNEIIKDEIDGLTENYLVDAKKIFQKMTRYLNQLKKHYLLA